MDTDAAAMDKTYERMIGAYRRIYERCGLQTVMVEADSGAIGGKDSHEFMLITPTGEDEIVMCPECGYAANMERAAFSRVSPERPEEPFPVEEVATPGMMAIAEVAEFLGVPSSRTLKAVFYTADGEVVFALIRGDLDVNEIKLKNKLKCHELRLATEAELTGKGLVAGYASPVGVSGVKVVADESIEMGGNFVVGANREGFHFRNVNYPRDFKVDIMADIALAAAGYGCPGCEGKLAISRGIEVGHTFKLGTVFSEKLGAVYLDRDGEQKPVVMGCYGIGIGRLLAAAVEQNHDEKGIIWPVSIAPFQVYLCALNPDRVEVAEAAEKVIDDINASGIQVLYDDREDSAGVKFNDADLMGIPVRVVISPRNLKQGNAEVKRRDSATAELVSLDGVAEKVREMLV